MGGLIQEKLRIIFSTFLMFPRTAIGSLLYNKKRRTDQKMLTLQVDLIKSCFRSSSDSASTQCITDLKQRLLKTAVSKNPQILNSVDNQQIKACHFLVDNAIGSDTEAVSNDAVFCRNLSTK